MRVLVLCTDQGVRVPGSKGAALHLRAVAEAYAALGHEVLLLGVAGHGDPPSHPRLRTHLLPHPGRAEGVLRERNKLALVERFVTEGGPVARAFAPDVVHERLSLFGTAGLRLARATGARHVVEVNALLAHEEARWRGLGHVAVAREREHAVLSGADLVVPVSDELTAEVRALLGPDAPVVTVANGVDPRPFLRPHSPGAVRARLGVPPGARLAVFTGTLRPWHGVEVAVDALAALDPDVHLVVVGDGPVRDELAARAEARGVGHRVHLVGALPHDEAVDAVRAAGVALAPYPDLPGFSFSPLKVYEYLAAGTPVVASDLGQPHALLAGLGVGRLVRPGDPADLALGIRAALAAGAGEAEAAVAVRVREEWSWASRVGDVLAALEQVTTGPGSAAAAAADLPEEDTAVAEALRRADRDHTLAGLRLGRVLRRVAGRRATFAARRADGEAVVVKAFASPRARGNARRLAALADAGLSDVVPTALATSDDGCVGVVSFRPGTVMEDLSDDAWLDACAATGGVLRRLHDSGAALDRRWTSADECAQLLRRAPAGCRDVAAAEAAAAPPDGTLVPSHRDLHPRQVVAVDGASGVCLIDLDDAALAPRGLDVGNMVAHLRREVVVGRRGLEVGEAAVDAFLGGYGDAPADLLAWERLALARLAGLAESRHGSPQERDALLRLLAERPAPPPPPVGLVPTGHADRPVRMAVDEATGRPVVVKTYLGADGSRVHDDMLSLWASPFGGSPHPRMPEPLSFDASSGDLVMTRVPGEAVAVRGALGGSVRRGADVGRLLAALHGSGADLHRVRDRRALVRSTHRKVRSLEGQARPHVHSLFRVVAEGIERRWAGTETGELVPSHGDFSPRNVHATADHVAIVDLDRLQLAERERDVAYWCAWLWVTSGGTEPLFTGPARPFLQGYTEAAGVPLRPDVLEMHAAVALVRIAHGWTSMRTNDSARVALLVAASALADVPVTPVAPGA
ncbi:glycosyltransferase [Phycicoccus sp. MAQZ13P-2]|uniref:glycosyltransferase n=1 Tax=Phycicoccus mangrovi TaxID=2840470 RepID=UPI001C005ACB|nr:glycosyltransferase [Phycicoccus mangrovi]MBT9257921.1 glycosyltransferase [Phycicoccus mangrovi]MBT9276387.1 glycosyltransferase [Phycicoccus mangrovi]